MAKKVTVEVFKDANYPELDGDEIAHALATVQVIKPFVEIVNRKRWMNLSGAHGNGVLERNKRILVPLDTDVAMLYTGRTIQNSTEQPKNTDTTGLFLASSRLCVVSTLTSNVERTARHEFGHYLYTFGQVVNPAADEIEHCPDAACVMYARHTSQNKPRKTTMAQNLAAMFGAQKQRYEDAIQLIEFCAPCAEPLGKSAYLLALAKDSPDLAKLAWRTFTN